MGYEAHESLVARARATASLWRLSVSFALLVICVMLFIAGYYAAHRAVAGPDAWPLIERELYTGSTPRGILLNLWIFGLILMALWVALRVAHRRGIFSLIGPGRRAFVQFKRAAIAVLVLNVVLSFILPLGDEFTLTPNLEFRRWIWLLPVGLLGLLIQTSTEELVFRGYLQSQLAARFSHPLVWITLPSLLFASLHYNPDFGQITNLFVLTWITLFALAAADLTARSGTLGPAIALHLVNNFNAIMIASPAGEFDGLALYTLPITLDDPATIMAWAPVELAMLLCSWLAVRVALRR